MMFDKELFYSLCEKYDVELSDTVDCPMIKDRDGVRAITNKDIELIFHKVKSVNRKGVNMSFRDFMYLYDDWNNNIKINNDNLQKIGEDKISEFVYEDGKFYNKTIMNAEVKSFGFYDNELCVRLNI